MYIEMDLYSCSMYNFDILTSSTYDLLSVPIMVTKPKPPQPNQFTMYNFLGKLLECLFGLEKYWDGSGRNFGKDKKYNCK